MAIKGDLKKVGLWLSGQDIIVPEANIYITQPKIKDIVLFGEDEFLIALNLIVQIKKFIDPVKQGNSQLEIYSDFQLFMIILQEDQNTKKLIDDLFELIFSNYSVSISDTSIDFITEIDEQQAIIGRITPFNFEALQNILSDLFLPQGDDKDIEYNPADDAAKAIAEKLMKGREKRKAAQVDQEGEYSLFSRYISTLSIGLSMDMNILYNYTPFQLYDAFKRYFIKQAYDLDMRVRTMPLMDTSKMDDPEDWTKNMYK